MLSSTYTRIEPANSSSPVTGPEAGAAAGIGPLTRSPGHHAELALSFAVVLLASGAVWGVSSWLLAAWQLN